MSYFNSRNRMNWLVILLLVINIGSLSALWLSRSDGKKPPRHHKADGEGFLAKKLELNEEQIKEVKKLREAHFQEMDALQRAAGMARRNMFEEIKAIKPDSILIVKYAAQIGNTVGAREELTSKHFLDIKAILTEKQLDQFNQVVGQLLPPPPHGRGRRGERPPPHPPGPRP